MDFDVGRKGIIDSPYHMGYLLYEKRNKTPSSTENYI